MTSNLLLLFFTAGPSISHFLIFLNQQFLKTPHPSPLSSFPDILLLSDCNLKLHVLSCRKYSQPTSLFSRLCTVNFLLLAAILAQLYTYHWFPSSLFLAIFTPGKDFL